MWSTFKNDIKSGWVIFKKDMEIVGEMATCFNKKEPISTVIAALLGTPVCFIFIFPAAVFGLILSSIGYYHLLNTIFKEA